MKPAGLVGRTRTGDCPEKKSASVHGTNWFQAPATARITETGFAARGSNQPWLPDSGKGENTLELTSVPVSLLCDVTGQDQIADDASCWM